MEIRVNGEKIPDAAIEYEFKRLIKFYSEHMPMDQIKQQFSVLRRRACDQAIGAKLLILEAERLDIAVPAARMDAKLAEMVAGAGGQEALDRVLSEQGLSMEDVRESVQRGLRVDCLVESITAGAPEPSEDEIRAHFEEHVEEYRIPDMAQAQHILIKVEKKDDEKEKAVALSKLEGIRRKIVDGADFGDLAAAYSDCPSGKQAGGSLGWFARGAMVPEFDEAVFSQAVGTLSEIVESPFGYHLIFKTGHDDARSASFEEVSDRVRDFLRHARRGEVLSAHVNELKEKAVIEEK